MASAPQVSDFEKSLLLQNGNVLTHQPSSISGEYDVVPLENHSILIVDGNISKIAINVPVPSETQVIDCTDKLICPGFIDTHRHLWQTQLKGRHADELLHEYFWSGNFQSVKYKSEDVFWGQLAGCLESIDGGTTIVVDHSHNNVTSEHTSWAPFHLDRANFMADRALKQLEDLSKSQPYGGDRVTIGLAFDGMFMPEKVVVDLFTNARMWGTRLITMHYLNSGGSQSHGSKSAKLADYGLMGPDILFSHLNEPKPEDAGLLKKWDMTLPVCFQRDLYQHGSLGVDCHSASPADLLSQMRIGLSAARGIHNQKFVSQRKSPKKMSSDLEVVKTFNLATIQGAKTIGREKELGSLQEGKKADITVLDATGPSMICASKEDPVASVVMHASVRDVETVIIGGIIRKKAGKLVNVTLQDEAMKFWDGIKEKELSWKKVSEALLKSRDNIIARMPDADQEKGVWDIADAFNFDKASFVDDI